MLMRSVLAAIFTFISAFAMNAADTMQGIFHPSFKTLEVYLASNRYAPDVVALNEPGDKIVISFDELSEDRRYMRYSLIHCDARWQPEGLVDSEFLDGFNEGTVNDYAFSEATLAHYVHYTITIPNDQMRIMQSGNYLLRVYDESDPDVTLLQARFGVSDFSADASISVSSRTDIDSNDAHQQVALSVDTKHIAVNDPFNGIKVVVSQNGRVDNEVVLTTPQRVNGDKLIYEHLRPLIFDAGNEYRRFETVSTSYPGIGIEDISYGNPYYNMTLAVDYPRNHSLYRYDSTQHGRFLVREVSADDSDTQADYVMVHFTLKMPELPGKELFLDGDFVNRRFDPASRMVYNRATGQYENSMLLKQGAYNYQYLAVPFGETEGSTSEVEGNFYQTGNEYVVKIYHRPKGERFDKLIGITQLTTAN